MAAGACCPTCGRKIAAPKKAKTSPAVKAFLKIRFPERSTKWDELPAGWRETQDAMSPEARAQFAYGGRDRAAPDAAVLYAARAPVELPELRMAA